MNGTDIYLHSRPEAGGIRVIFSLPSKDILHVYAERGAISVYVDVRVKDDVYLCGLAANPDRVEVFSGTESVPLDDVYPANFRITSQFGINYNSVELTEGNRHFTVTYDDVYRGVIVRGDVSVLIELIQYVLF